MNALADGKMVFKIAGAELRFASSDCLLTVSLPSFYSIAPTAYDILHSQGVQIGKRHFLGKMRIG